MSAGLLAKLGSSLGRSMLAADQAALAAAVPDAPCTMQHSKTGSVGPMGQRCGENVAC